MTNVSAKPDFQPCACSRVLVCVCKCVCLSVCICLTLYLHVCSAVVSVLRCHGESSAAVAERGLAAITNLTSGNPSNQKILGACGACAGLSTAYQYMSVWLAIYFVSFA